MRLLSALFAGILSFAAFGGAVAHGQENASRYWVNPALTGEWRDRGERPSAQEAAKEEDFSLGFTLNGFGGINGSLELGRVTLSPDATDQIISAYGHPELGGGPVDETIGEASINWSLTDRLEVSTSYSRGVASEPTLIAGTPVFEDSISGGVTFAITPRFAVSARGTRRLSADSNTVEMQDFTGDGAALNAEYQFMPSFSGSVNYSYESYDGQEGVLRHDESTLSLSLTGRF